MVLRVYILQEVRSQPLRLSSGFLADVHAWGGVMVDV